MNQIDFAPLTVPGGFFLLGSSRSALLAPFTWQPDSGSQRRFLGTYCNSGAPIREALVDALRAARKRVFVASFMLGDELLIEELIAAADRLQGGVYVITALDERSLRKGLDEYDLTEQEAPEERQKNFVRLTSAGVYVRGHESCHAKFAVIDDQTAMVGSANFVTKGFEWTGEANVLFKDPAGVQQLARLFTELWFEGCVWEVPPGQTYVVARRTAETPPARPEAPTGDTSEVVWTDGGESSPLIDAIHHTIKAARHRLTLSSYSIVGMKEHPSLLLDPVRDAVGRGVAVRLFLRHRNAYPDQIADVLALHDLGVQIHADTRNHAKLAIADDRLAVVFSANFHAYQGLRGSVEVGVRVDDEETIHELLRYMDHAVEYADTQFVRDPTHAELDGRLAARWCQEWKGPKAVIARYDDRQFATLAKEASCGPCLFEREGQRFRLFLGTITAEGGMYDGKATIDSPFASVECSSSNRMKEWLQSVRKGGQHANCQRGFFSGGLVREESPTM